MTDETTTQEPIEAESAPQQVESAPEQAAEPEVEEVEKEPTDKKALREARRDAKKAERKLKRAEKQLEQSRQQVSRRYPIQPPSGGDAQEIQKQEAAMFRQMQQEQFVEDTTSKLGLERDDKRLDYSTPESFMMSAAMAKEEDFQDREAELAEQEEKLESLGDRLRAEAKEALAQEIRDFRRDAGLDTVARVTETAGVGDADTKVAAIEAEYADRLQLLRRSGQTGEAYRLLKEKEKKIEEVRAEQ